MTIKLLYICTHNRCRSVLSEAITNSVAASQFTAYSAGSAPAGEIHPATLKHLLTREISVDGLSSQSWDDFGKLNPDIVITVCDSAANEACPIWMGSSLKLHWGLSDPSKIEGSEADIGKAFNEVMNTIERRVKALSDLDLSDLSNPDTQQQLREIAKIQ